LNTIKSDIKDIKKYLLQKYNQRIIRNLVKILNVNNPLTLKSKADIKFLVNALIIELYISGYSLNYIKNLPNIILFPKEYKGQFPFSKTRIDFSSDTEHEQYIDSELEYLDLNKQILSFHNLINNSKKKGFYIFKIDNLDFLEEPITIWNTTFYNPQKNLELDYSKFSNEDKKEFQDYEKFCSDKDADDGTSTCNAIIEVEYQTSRWNHHDNSPNLVLKNVNNSLNVLKYLKYAFIGGNSKSSKICKKEYIIANEERKYHMTQQIDFGSNFSFEIKDEQRQFFNARIDQINKLNENTDFQNKLIEIYNNLCKLSISPIDFNFKDYWTIFIEALFPNDPKGYIEFCQKCFKFRLEKDFFLNAKTFLFSSFKDRPFLEKTLKYWLTETILINLGLFIPLNTSINARKFMNQYTKLKDYLSFTFLDDIIDELNNYKNNKQQYYNSLDHWIEKTIYQVYAERNLEAHNNISTELSLIKLKDSFLHIANTVILVSATLCTKNVKSIDDIYNKI